MKTAQSFFYFTNRILFLCFIFGKIIVNAQVLNEAPKILNQESYLPEGSSKNAKASAMMAASCNRTAIVNNYNTNFVGSECDLTTLAWTGNTTGCLAGTISSTAQTLSFQRINYYRNLVGLANVTYTNSYDTQTQAASLMMKAANTLNHCVGSPDPCSSLACYSTTASTGAQNSNLALGTYASSAIRLYMDDPGGGNIYAGHRRWILYSRALTFGHGCTNNSDALWVFGTTGTPSSPPAYIAFPVAGYMPRTLIPQRWSFGIPSADFSSATVTMLDESNATISITQNVIGNGYGDNTIVWDLATAPTFSGNDDVAYKVTVSGVKIGGVTQNPYTYNVVATDATSDATLTIATTNPNCGQGMNTATATANFSKGAKSYAWSNGANTQTISGLAPGTYTVTVTDKNNCTYSQSVTISGTVSTTPAVVNNAVNPNCAGTIITLTASNCSGTYSWTNSLGNGAVKTVTPSITTSYGVNCTEGTCVASANANTNVTVTPSPTVACLPIATNGLSQFYGVASFVFNGTPAINSTSYSSLTDGKSYVDKSCIVQSSATPNATYSISVGGYYINTHNVKVYIDYNNNGNFTDAGETVLSGNTSGAGTNLLTGNITIPATATTNTLLRVRVLADPITSSNSCTITGYAAYGSGQIEDYALTVGPCAMYSIKSGNWNDSSVWSCSKIPDYQDIVTITAGHTVTVPSAITAHAKDVKAYGILTVQQTGLLKLVTP